LREFESPQAQFTPLEIKTSLKTPLTNPLLVKKNKEKFESRHNAGLKLSNGGYKFSS